MYKLPKHGGVLIDRDLLSSEAFRGLSGLAVQIYMMLRLNAKVVRVSSKRARVAEWAVQNNGSIRLTYKQIEKSLFMKPGSGGRRISSAFDELISRGLVDLGIAGSGRCGAMNGYGFSDRWKRFGKLDFKQAPPNSYRAVVRKRAQSASRTPDGRFSPSTHSSAGKTGKGGPRPAHTDGKALKELAFLPVEGGNIEK